jgi:HK97 family phage major capsid protein
MATKIFEVREKLATALNEYRAIVSKEADLPTDETLPDEDVSRFAVLEAEITVLKARVDRLEAVEAMPEVPEASGDTEDKALAGLTTKQFTPARPTVPAQAATPIEKGLRAARFLIGQAIAGKQGARFAADQIQKSFGDDIVAKAVMTVSGTGSTTIPTYSSTEIIELLRAMVAVRAAGAATIDTTGGNLTIPRLAGAATANWGTENSDIMTSNETIDTVVLSNHKLVSMVTVSNDLRRRSPLGLDTIVRDDLLAVMSRAEDVAFLSGASGGANPTGLLKQIGIQSMFALSSDLPGAVAGVQVAVTRLQMANTRMLRPAWIMSPMTKNWLASQRDSVGGWFTYKQELDNNMLAGYPVFTTTNLAVNLTNHLTGSTGSMVLT